MKKDIVFKDELKLLSDIPKTNKVVLQDIWKDEPFIRYGEIIKENNRPKCNPLFVTQRSEFSN